MKTETLKTKLIIFSFITIGILLFGGCQYFKCKKKEIKEDAVNAINKLDAYDIKLTPSLTADDFHGVKLEIAKITTEKESEDSVTLRVNYKLKNFTLTKNTDDAKCNTLANSHQGQHIHFILDNQPYIALYSPKYSIKLKKGTEHYLLSFLSRSYHESIKHDDAAVLIRFEITEKGEYKELPIETTPMLFYSRPKDTYKGVDSKSVLLDFYLTNVTLAEDGNKIAAKINDKEFIIDKWQAYEIQGLPMGESTITLKLVNSYGKPIQGAYTTITRNIMLTK